MVFNKITGVISKIVIMRCCISVGALISVMLALTVVDAATLLQPLWSTQLPSTAVPPTGTTLGWSLFAGTTGTDGYYITTTADHTLVVLSSVNATVGVAWSYSAWNDNVTSSVAYGRSFATATLPETGATTLLVQRGPFLHVFDLQIGYLIGVQNVTLNGEVPSSIESVTSSLLLLQYNDYIAVTDGYGNIKWSQPMLSGNDVRTYSAAAGGASYIALVQPVANDPAGEFGVTVLTTQDGSLVYRATFHAATIEYFYLMVVESTSVTFLIIQNGKQYVSRFMFDGTELYSLQVFTNIWGYGVEAGQLVLQVEDDPGLSINFYNYTTAAPIAQTGLIPQTVAGEGHIVGEPEYALLAFVTNSTQFHLTGWTATNGQNRFNFTFDFSAGKHNTVAPRARHQSKISMLKRRVGYSADANIMMANWNGQIFVPGPSGFHYVDGNRAALDNTYKSSFGEIVFPATALTNNVLVVVSGSTVSAFQLL